MEKEYKKFLGVELYIDSMIFPPSAVFKENRVSIIVHSCEVDHMKAHLYKTSAPPARALSPILALAPIRFPTRCNY